ncbi:metal ABC transporter ATP-binding protein [Euhalothece natronophila Z-M001]|uniref:Metal ABC transporter ATP-binding protein n=1 Tax=Euhalothece natronophila Z-M001 TaxID=522448 RepID=A0A5B8NT24_9CHRO|nr:metal ABC transporter ATP-binding protein [Euhalothece natronophila]QDZ41485.1 metal ABC transporter ATP-binding protein [Euhalothece natronophila Z-M001]
MTTAGYRIGESSLLGVDSPQPVIQVKNLNVSYRGVEALQGINCEFQAGRLTGIIGPNGAGKSTLLKAMLGLLPAKGKVKWGNGSLATNRSRLAYVPQRSKIDWDYPVTVWDVVMMGRVKATGWLRRFSASSRHIALESLKRVGMEKLRDRAISQLSGGQQQRVFLARALAQQAEIFFLDEPFVGVDQKTQNIIFGIFRELTASGKTVIVINHDLGATITHFDDLILLNKELIAAGTRETVLTKENLYAAYDGQVMFFSDAA